MSLTDLKRKQQKQKPKTVSIEDFIEDAVNYAVGKPSRIEKAVNQPKRKSPPRKFRHATFSLSEASIRQLDDVAQSTGIAKSRLLRMFIHYYCDLTDEEQQALLTQVEGDAAKKG
ncbi:replication protein RepA [Shewanella yunxiaonensis]|uniref:Replication protein RepA n=1 Tax=Shewanella yunxiaonensis TaxID=2829809 RepID=A0ABX7YW68_9GAMM|nr:MULTISPECIES: replication protein RepA [Shewanella]MDF0534234.1 replication protein RepA [Shewanella sp. A32]QUN07014.1 replication protein RepA [Shewanella yunxiaonensis]